MFALLGEIAFEAVPYVDGLEHQRRFEYAAHELIEGKPRLQWIGEGLAELRIDLSFHAAFCKPAEEMTRLREAAARHEAMALVYGSGTHEGMFVLTEIQSTSTQTDPEGRVIAMTARISLKEWVEDAPAPDVAATAPGNNEGRQSGAAPVARRERVPTAPTSSPDAVSAADIVRS